MKPSTELYQDLESDDYDRQIRAADILCKAADPGAIPYLIALLGSPDSDLRSVIASWLSGYGRGSHAASIGPALVMLLNDADEDCRFNAAETLAIFGYREAAPDLSRVLLSDQEWLVRVAAADALAEVGYARNAGDLAAALRDDEDRMVRASAAGALGVVGGPEAVPALREAYARESELRPRVEIAGALYRLGQREFRDDIFEILREADEEIASCISGIALDVQSRVTPAYFAEDLEAWARELRGIEKNRGWSRGTADALLAKSGSTSNPLA